MTYLLADVSVTNLQLGLTISALGVIGGIYGRMMAVRKDLADEIITRIKAEQQPPVHQIGGQPIKIEQAEHYTPRASFDRHAQINREEHARIEAKAERELQRMEAKIDHAKAEILTAGEQREVRLQHRINELADSVGRLVGRVEQMNQKRS